MEQPHLSLTSLKLEVPQEGSGRPLLLLRGSEPPGSSDKFIRALAERYKVIAPWGPGFGSSDLPDDFDSIEDVVYAHLELMEKMDLADAIVVGLSFGGWIAAELAVRNTSRIKALVLVDALGLRVGTPTDRPIADIYAMDDAELATSSYHNAEFGTWNAADKSDAELLKFARGRDAQARFGWKPFMHNPALSRWLHRIDRPTLVAWGEQDRIAAQSLGKAYASGIPNAQFRTVPDAGHFPHIERPEYLSGEIIRFADALE